MLQPVISPDGLLKATLSFFFCLKNFPAGYHAFRGESRYFPRTTGQSPASRSGTLVIWRARDANNYYIARANALEDNVTIYHTVNGRRTSRENPCLGTGFHVVSHSAG